MHAPNCACAICHSEGRGAWAFTAWKAEVSREIESRTGLDIWDIEDWKYRDAFDDGMDPEEAAILALENSGWEGEGT